MVKRRKSSVKKAKRKGSERTASSPKRPPKQRAWDPTELARVKHYVLHGISEEHYWPDEYGIYLCGENYPECKLPFFEPDDMENCPYKDCNLVHSSSLFHLNSHMRCTLPYPVTCSISTCNLEFHKADTFLDHLQKCHVHTYLQVWIKSGFAFKPDAQQMFYGMHSVMTNNRVLAKLKWVCIYCMCYFSSPEVWQNHRQFSQVCRTQVVEIIWNSLNDKWKTKWRMLSSSFKNFTCSVCTGTSSASIKDIQTAGSPPSVSVATPEEDERNSDGDSSANQSEIVVMYGSLSELMNHICERHTNQAFICLTCAKVISVDDNKHHRKCLNVSDEGLVGCRTIPISDQILLWANEVINTLIARDEVKCANNSIATQPQKTYVAKTHRSDLDSLSEVVTKF